MDLSKSFLKLSFTGVLILLLVFYCAKNPEVLHYILHFPFLYIVCLIALHLIFHLFNALILIELINPFLDRSTLTFSNIVMKLFGIVQVSSLANYLIPFRIGGLGTRMVYLKKFFNIDASYTASTFLVTSLILISLSSGMIYFLFKIMDNANLPYKHTADLFFLLNISLVIIVWFSAFAIKTKPIFNNIIFRYLFTLHQGIFLIPTASHIKICILFLLQTILGSIIMWILLSAVNQPVSVLTCIFLTAIGNLSMLISVTPGNIGIKELTVTGAALYLGIQTEPMLGALLVDRIILLLITCFSSAYFILGGHSDFNIKMAER